jgi:hypothetical protein
VKRSTRPSRRTIKGGSAGGCAPAAAASRFRNSDSIQTLSKLGNAGNAVEGMRRGVWARFSGTRGCGILPATVALVRLQDGEVSRGLHREPWDFRLRNFFLMLHAQGFRIWRRAGWTWLDSGQRPNAFHGFLTFLILLCSRSGHKTGIDVACARLLLASAGRLHTNGMASRPAGRGPSS